MHIKSSGVQRKWLPLRVTALPLHVIACRMVQSSDLERDYETPLLVMQPAALAHRSTQVRDAAN